MRPDIKTKTYCEADEPLTVMERLANLPPCDSAGLINESTLLVYFPMTLALLVMVGFVVGSYYY
jgi:hypothetical protein